MPSFSPAQLASWTGGRWTAQPVSSLLAFAIDSRQLRRGDVFVAIKSEQRDGHAFLGAAEAAGASAALVSTPDPALALPQLVVADPLRAFQAIAREHRRLFRGPVVGISGSAGKTSTKNLLALLLETAAASSDAHAGQVLATEGNLNNHLGVPLTLTLLDPAVHRFAVVEAGISAPGEMAPLAEMIQPDVALITLVAAAHTEELGGLAGVAKEKAVLPAAVPPTGIAIFPKHCTEFAAFRELDVQQMVVERADVIRPAQPPRDKVFFTVSHRDEHTVVALAYGPPPPLTFTLRRVSDGMAQNAALAICAALWLGVPAESIQQRLAQWQPAKLRGELRRENGRWLYLDCYNANPASMTDALEAFYGMAPTAEPRLFVLGGMEELGREAAGYHHELGRALRLRAGDQAVVIGEHAPAVRAGALAAGTAPDQVRVAESLEPIAVQVAAWRGAVFVKGSRRYALEKVLATKPEETQR
ncbi:UDP-N-acetylmuramoyl-tripeptide--D-alanyl-D-alanine ligase [Opitutus terrae]|uniref:UDP-N-acetylmuramoyl-tripeptide--D-alanyl-D-alanine ligase n=1 Tax=Opitutus terrae (strain DSM 11246 / JCM 15787 / PB90-1) TaxID=452637 RepID=B1ZU29_OPITP|nr:UDP-N-acetylmuramoyl-tripeptide--D-alanyl-D-alanine ligase [Opitutus terrae]ACB75911.1 UDP-N-acetylmuramoylalanyl-D-glutamyl-2,6-diaminopimelate--D-alanyl-D-alanyl ligase [Opitutus terrae PB90-1]